MKSTSLKTYFLSIPTVLMGICLLSMLLTSCNYGTIDLDVQGHRGCRGLMPENSIPAFQRAWELGVTTLELDVVISKDRQVVVSHEAWFSHECCTNPDGIALTEANEKQFNLYQMDYADIIRWDCGTRPHPRFPDQEKIKVVKPLLREVFTALESSNTLDYYNGKEKPLPQYNIEIKTEPDGVGVFHPNMHDFAALVLEEIHSQALGSRTTIQSFDLEALRETRRQDRDIALGLLIEEDEDYKTKLGELGFYPEILSPEWHLVDEPMLTFAAEKNMKVIPWTVNEPADMRKLIKLGVHGIISDYPDRLLNLLKEI